MREWVTCGEAIGDLDYDLPEDSEMQAGSKHKDLLKEIPPGENYLYFTKERGHPNPQFKWRSRYWSFLLKLSPDKPSWTIQASFSNNMGPFHWKNRFLRISEIKRIQTFPDDYEITGDFKEQWRQIGNAVPPLLVKKIAENIKEQYLNLYRGELMPDYEWADDIGNIVEENYNEARDKVTPEEAKEQLIAAFEMFGSQVDCVYRTDVNYVYDITVTSPQGDIENYIVCVREMTPGGRSGLKNEQRIQPESRQINAVYDEIQSGNNAV